MYKGEVFQRLDLEIAVCVGGARAPVSEVCNASRVPGFFFLGFGRVVLWMSLFR